MGKSFSTTGALCRQHATLYQGIAPDAELWIRYDDDGWLATHFESDTEWTIDTRDVEPLRAATEWENGADEWKAVHALCFFIARLDHG